MGKSVFGELPYYDGESQVYNLIKEDLMCQGFTESEVPVFINLAHAWDLSQTHPSITTSNKKTCSYCGQWGSPKTTCEYCGGRIDP